MDKTYNIMFNVGKVKYLVNYHNGVNTHKDGSKFYDIACFKNKVKLNEFVKSLVLNGYKECGR